MCKLLVYGFFEEIGLTILGMIWLICWIIDGSCEWLYRGLKIVMFEIIEAYTVMARIAYEALSSILKRFNK